MPTDRRNARIIAMQMLCAWDVQQQPASEDTLRDFFDHLMTPQPDRDYAAPLVLDYWQSRRRVDKLIADTATHWKLSRISPVERNAMRVAIVEIMHDRVPPKVAVDEAIEIAREFGGAASPGFVNGVLDSVLRRLKPELSSPAIAAVAEETAATVNPKGEPSPPKDPDCPREENTA